jgi:hypothetical protein
MVTRLDSSNKDLLAIGRFGGVQETFVPASTQLLWIYYIHIRGLLRQIFLIENISLSSSLFYNNVIVKIFST